MLSANELTPLMAAVNNKDQEFVNFLLNNGAVVNTKGKDKRTALHLAVMQRDAEMVKYLIQRAGASKKVADALGKTPLQLAKKMEDKTIAKTILRSTSYVKLSSEYSIRENQYLKEVAKRAAILEKRDGRDDRVYIAYTYDSICTYGITWGTLNNKSIGYYITARSNDDAFTLGGANGTVDNNGVVTGGQFINWGNDWRFKNEIKTGTTEVLIGVTKKITYPFWIYAGAGVSYNNVFWKMDIYDNLGDYFDTDWVENTEAAKFNPIFEAGLIMDLKGFNLRGGIKTQTFKDLTLTLGVGFSFPR
jgi:opacity protein-like surface antigen